MTAILICIVTELVATDRSQNDFGRLTPEHLLRSSRVSPQQADGFIAEVKHRQDIHQLEVTMRKRNKLLHDIVDLLRSTLDL